MAGNRKEFSLTEGHPGLSSWGGARAAATPQFVQQSLLDSVKTILSAVRQIESEVLQIYQVISDRACCIVETPCDRDDLSRLWLDQLGQYAQTAMQNLQHLDDDVLPG